MTDTGISRAPQQYQIWINAVHGDDTHPEQSTMDLELQGPFPLTEVVTEEMVQAQRTVFKPGDDVTVNSGDTVTWVIKAAGVDSILILHKDKGKNVFESGPAPASSGKDWSGIVKKVKSPEGEPYAICWSQGGKTYCFDPKITVNP